MIKTAMVGLGKMGLSHLAILRAHPDLDVVAGCDATAYLTDILTKHTGIEVLRRLRRACCDRRRSTRSSSRRRRSCMRRWCKPRSSAACTSSARSPSCSTSPTASGWSRWREAAGASPRSATTTASSAPSRRRRASSNRARSGDGPPRARRGLRPGRAAQKGRHLALGEERGRRRALRLRMPCDRPRQLRRRDAVRGERRGSPRRLLARRRRRDLLHACASPTAPAASSA